MTETVIYSLICEPCENYWQTIDRTQPCPECSSPPRVHGFQVIGARETVDA